MNKKLIAQPITPIQVKMRPIWLSVMVVYHKTPKMSSQSGIEKIPKSQRSSVLKLTRNESRRSKNYSREYAEISSSDEDMGRGAKRSLYFFIKYVLCRNLWQNGFQKRSNRLWNCCWYLQECKILGWKKVDNDKEKSRNRCGCGIFVFWWRLRESFCLRAKRGVALRLPRSLIHSHPFRLPPSLWSDNKIPTHEGWGLL